MTAATNITPLGYAAAAPLYWSAGWRGVLPIPRAQKTPPPAGRTGHSGTDPSYPDLYAWTEEHADGNIALRMPGHIIGIDVDDYGTKTGRDTLAHAEQQWGTLPATIMSTSRTNGSGIRYYQIPAGLRLKDRVAFTDHGLGGIEIIQRHHRYALVWPSIHRDTGGMYQWIGPDGNTTKVPAPDQFPHLPQRWIEELSAPAAPVPSGPVEPVTVSDGNPDLKVSERLARALSDLAGPIASRHDTTRDHVLALLRCSEQGRPGVQHALDQLRAAFIHAVSADHTRTTASADTEFQRMIDGQRGHQLIAATPTPSPEAHEPPAVTGLIALADAQRQRHTEPPHTDEDDDDDQVTRSDVIDQLTDSEFWAASPALTAVYEKAHARLASPWSVLGATLARALTLVPPWVTLPPIIGGRGSLNCFWALVGRSGAGKGISEAVAAELIPLPTDIAVLPAGSGEGLAHAYVRRATAKEIKDEHADPAGIIRERTSALFSIPEVDTLASIGGRQGATIMSKLRSAYSGEEIGFSYADPTKRLLVGSHQYRLQMILGVQPERAAGLLQDAAGGTPQRFVWLPANDPMIGTIDGADHSPLAVAGRAAWGGHARHVDIPDHAADEIRDAHIARARGEGDAIDGHALQTREKVAVALAVLEGRTIVDDVDWMLAGKIMAVSDRIRTQIAQEVQAAAEHAAEVAGREWGIRNDAANLSQAQHRERRIAGVILRVLARKGGAAVWSEVRRAVASRDRLEAVEVIDELVADGVLRVIDVDATTRRLELIGGPENA